MCLSLSREMNALRKKREPKWLSWRVIFKIGSLLWRRAVFILHNHVWGKKEPNRTFFFCSETALLWRVAPKWSSKESWVTDNQMAFVGEPFWLSFFSQCGIIISHKFSPCPLVTTLCGSYWSTSCNVVLITDFSWWQQKWPKTVKYLSDSARCSCLIFRESSCVSVESHYERLLLTMLSYWHISESVNWC